MDITLPNFHNARVLVFGDVMLDRYWQGSTSRISPEAPVPVVKIQDIENRAGGAGNVALGIAALGASFSRAAERVGFLVEAVRQRVSRARACLPRRPGWRRHDAWSA